MEWSGKHAPEEWPLIEKLPMLDWGSIMINADWMHQPSEGEQLPASLPPDQAPCWRLMERVIHGLLHVSGQHHDTTEDYNRVVHIQQTVLSHCFGVPVSDVPERKS